MKVWVLLGVVLIGATIVNLTDAHGYEDLVAKLNYERKEWANGERISNMYKLKWSDALAQAANFSVTDLESYQPNFRYFYVGRNADAISYNLLLSDWFMRDPEKNRNAHLNWLSKNKNSSRMIFGPNSVYMLHAREIGCSPHQFKESVKVRNVELEAEYTSICFIGPRFNLTQSFGPAGSACGDDDVENGLCISKQNGGFPIYGQLPPGYPETVPTSEKVVPENVTHSYGDLLAKLNYDRREYAKAHNVSNMYKLKWSDAIVKYGNTLDNKNIQGPPALRHFFTGKNAAAAYYETFEAVNADSQWRKNQSYDSQTSHRTTVWTLEQLVPLQKQIGCIYFPREKRNVKVYGFNMTIGFTTLCLMKPELHFITTVRKSGPPGTDCDEGDNVEDGLCVSSEPEDSEPHQMPELNSVPEDQEVSRNGTIESPETSGNQTVEEPEYIPAPEDSEVSRNGTIENPESSGNHTIEDSEVSRNGTIESPETSGNQTVEEPEYIPAPHVSESSGNRTDFEPNYRMTPKYPDIFPNGSLEIPEIKIEKPPFVPESPQAHPVPEDKPEATQTEPVPAARQVPKGPYDDLVNKLNYERREYAKAKNISNMFKLIYNSDLAEIAGNISENWHRREYKYRYFFVGRNSDAMEFEHKIASWIDDKTNSNDSTLKEWTDSNEHKTVITMEKFLAEQKDIGCAPWKRFFIYNTFGRYFNVEYSTICVVGPETSYKNSQRKSGPAGSQCYEHTKYDLDDSGRVLSYDLGIKDDGLCEFEHSDVPDYIRVYSNNTRHSFKQSSKRRVESPEPLVSKEW